MTVKVWWPSKRVISTQTLHYKWKFDQYNFLMKGISDISFKGRYFHPEPIICLAVENCFPMKSLHLLVLTCYDSDSAWGDLLVLPAEVLLLKFLLVKTVWNENPGGEKEGSNPCYRCPSHGEAEAAGSLLLTAQWHRSGWLSSQLHPWWANPGL